MKVFGIGYNKTGTTSLSQIFLNNKLSVAPQIPFEYNLESYFYKNYSTFINMIKEDYCDYVLFQDVPFSLPGIYQTLDREFPNSKFILTLRDDENEWYQSLIRFYKKIFVNFSQPALIDKFVYKGVLLKVLTKVYGSPKFDPYNEHSLKNSYLNHIQEVEKYFQGKDNLLVLNLKDPNSISKLEDFLGVTFLNKTVPHLNRTK